MVERMYTSRVQALKRLQKTNGVECVALVPGANLRYFTGLTNQLTERPAVAFIPAQGSMALVLPELEVAAAKAHLPENARLFTYRDEEGPELAFMRVAEALALSGKPIGVEYLTMRMLEMRRIEQTAAGCKLLATEPWLPLIRMCKGQPELALMRHAVQIAERAMERLLDEKAIRPGRTELEVAADLRIAMLREGGQGEAFSPIVAAGPNSAAPHTTASDRRLAEGDLVVIDWGAVYEGYRSDITRTFVMGSPSSQATAIYDIVLTANRAGRMAVRAGMPAQEIDHASRRPIILAGYEQHFTHRTGHGLGLETHEPPYIVQGNPLLLQTGMTFTVEPGIYLPGVGGVRIEDDVLVSDEGCETLTTMPRELISL